MCSPRCGEKPSCTLGQCLSCSVWSFLWAWYWSVVKGSTGLKTEGGLKETFPKSPQKLEQAGHSWRSWGKEKAQMLSVVSLGGSPTMSCACGVDGLLLLQECWQPVLGRGWCYWSVLFFSIPDSSSLSRCVCQQLCLHAWRQAGMGLNAAGGSSWSGNKLYLYAKPMSRCQITGSIFHVCLHFAKW